MSARVVRWHALHESPRLGLLVETDGDHAKVVALDEARGVRVYLVPLAVEAKHGRMVETKFTDVTHEYKPYPVNRAVRHLLGMGERWGITNSAKRALREAT